MGSVWLLDLPDAIRDYGVGVDFYPGWETRSRSSGGLNEIRGIGVHDDAAPVSQSLSNRFAYAWNNSTNRPIGNAWILRSGRVMFGAAGAANTMGTSERDIPVSKGIIPRSQGNLYMVAYEAENDGVGQVWTEEQCEAYEKTVAATCDFGGLQISDVFAHFEYTNRKIDASGPTQNKPYGKPGSGSWNMESFRNFVQLEREAMSQFDTDLAIHFAPSGPFRLLDTRGKSPMQAQEARTILPDERYPVGTKGLLLNITTIHRGVPGFMTVYASGSTPGVSNVPVSTNEASMSNLAVVPLSGYGTFVLYSYSQADVILDVVGYLR